MLQNGPLCVCVCTVEGNKVGQLTNEHIILMGFHIYGVVGGMEATHTLIYTLLF